MLFVKLSEDDVKRALSTVIVHFDNVRFPKGYESGTCKEVYCYCDEANHLSVRGIVNRIDQGDEQLHVSVQWQTAIEEAY